MKQNQWNPKTRFVKEPEEFNKYTKREQLQYCLGTLLYMSATKDFAQAIVSRKYPELTSIAMCFEDACEDEKVAAAEQNTLHLLDTLSKAIQNKELSSEDIPLIFFRVRSTEQFKNFSQQLKLEHIRLVAGFIFPKFNSQNSVEYLLHLKALNERYKEPIYGMPILEDSYIAWKETRMEELLKIKATLDQHKDFILNVRVGCTDFSSCFGVRRSPHQTIYDVITVRDCLADILNVFSRNNDYVVSAPVWEYFSTDSRRDPTAIDGLIKELNLDKANGFVGKTCIHPTQVHYVNGMHAVMEDEYKDAQRILGMSSGVAKGNHGMMEAKPHRRWAECVVGRATAYGVVKDEDAYGHFLHDI